MTTGRSTRACISSSARVRARGSWITGTRCVAGPHWQQRSVHACDPTCAPRSTAECVGRRAAPDAVRACATLGQLRQVSNEPERPRAESRARVPLARALAHPSYWERPARSLPRRQGMRAAFATHTQDGRRAVRRRGLWAAHSAVVRKGDRDALLRVWDCLCIPKAAY